MPPAHADGLHPRLPERRRKPPPAGPRLRACVLAAAAALPALATSLSLPAFLAAQESKGAAPVAIDWTAERQFWSFRRPAAQVRPAVHDAAWPRQPLDWFVLARLERNALTPSPEASRLAFIRRLTYDLAGLPPTSEEVDAFLQDGGDPDGACERAVERLLASPRFGERLASLWLPLARYGEDQAHQVGDDTKFFYPNAYLYRKWVIDAFNRDLPYDRFLRLQIAADRFLPSGPRPEPARIEAAVPAAGGATPAPAAPDAAPASPPPAPAAAASGDAEDLAALGFIGLGPKYYNRNQRDVMADEWEDSVDTVTRALLGLTVACARCHDHKLEPITQGDYYGLAGVFASTRLVNRKPDGGIEKDDIQAGAMNAGTLHIAEDGKTTTLNVFIRGNPDRPGPVAERRFIRILCEGEPAPFRDGSGRRELAEAVASPDNPLTARVLVNRIWGLMFGRPLVSTPSNFGKSGSLPSNPELLDDLAVRFMAGGWSIKALVREMALSAAYRQGSRQDAARAQIDPTNELLWRMNRRRLSIEQWRDAALFVSGELAWDSSTSLNVEDPNCHRRTVYARISRLKLNDVLAQFDYPDANVHAEKRSSTITPMQKLFLLNSPFMMARTAALASRLAADAGEDNRARVPRAYRLLFGRGPDEAELRLALEFLEQPAAAPGMQRWEQYTQILLASNEMLYVD